MDTTTTQESEMTDQPYHCSLCDKTHRPVADSGRQIRKVNTYQMHRPWAVLVRPAAAGSDLETIAVSAPTREAVPAAVMAQVHRRVIVVDATVAYMNRSGWGYTWNVTYRVLPR